MICLTLEPGIYLNTGEKEIMFELKLPQTKKNIKKIVTGHLKDLGQDHPKICSFY